MLSSSLRGRGDDVVGAILTMEDADGSVPPAGDATDGQTDGRVGGRALGTTGP